MTIILMMIMDLETMLGINYDEFCGGYHRAFDLYNNSSGDIPAVTSGTVITSETHGNFGGTIEIRDANGNDWFIYTKTITQI